MCSLDPRGATHGARPVHPPGRSNGAARRAPPARRANQPAAAPLPTDDAPATGRSRPSAPSNLDREVMNSTIPRCKHERGRTSGPARDDPSTQVGRPLVLAGLGRCALSHGRQESLSVALDDRVLYTERHPTGTGGASCTTSTRWSRILHDHSVAAVGIHDPHPGLCGMGQLPSLAPDLYPLNAERPRSTIRLMEAPGEHADDARLGALACPRGAIARHHDVITMHLDYEVVRAPWNAAHRAAVPAVAGRTLSDPSSLLTRSWPSVIAWVMRVEAVFGVAGFEPPLHRDGEVLQEAVVQLGRVPPELLGAPGRDARCDRRFGQRSAACPTSSRRDTSGTNTTRH